MLRMVRLLSASALSLTLLFLVGCSTKRDPLYCDINTPCAAGMTCNVAIRTCEPTKTDGGTTEGGGGDLGTNLPLGSSCKAASECTSGFCADGVCCESACTDTCRSCALSGSAGQCKGVPEGEDPKKQCGGKNPACGGSCDGKGACSFTASKGKECGSPVCTAGSLTLSACDDAGTCATTNQTCGGYACDSGGTTCKTTCTTASADCTGTAQCIGGKCVANQPLGEPCGTNNDACASKLCVDGVCCDTACTGKCMRCNLATKGKCSPIPATQDPDKECLGKDAACSGSCNGAGACAFPTATKTCPGKDVACSGTCNGAGTCSYATIVGKQCLPPTCASAIKSTFACDATGGCVKTSAACPGLYTCNATGGCLTSCVTHAQCTTGFCDLFGFPHGAALKNTCVAAANLCTVSTTVADSFQACLNTMKKYVAVPDGTFPENLTTKAAVQIVATSKIGPFVVGPVYIPTAPAAKLRPPTLTQAGLLINHPTLVYGLEIFYLTPGSQTLVNASAQAQIRSCWIRNAGTGPSSLDIYASSELLVSDVALSNATAGIWSLNTLTLDTVTIGLTTAAGIVHEGAGTVLSARDLFVAFNGGAGIRAFDTQLDIDRAFIGVNTGGAGLDCDKYVTGRVSNTLINGNGQEGVKAMGIEPWFFNVTIADNGGLEAACGSSMIVGGAANRFWNSILWDKSNPSTTYSGDCSFEYSDVQGGTGGKGVNNINADPKISYGSGLLMYDLLTGSPCQNTGAASLSGYPYPLYDVAKRPRIYPAGGKIDMGAFERQAP